MTWPIPGEGRVMDIALPVDQADALLANLAGAILAVRQAGRSTRH